MQMYSPFNININAAKSMNLRFSKLIVFSSQYLYKCHAAASCFPKLVLILFFHLCRKISLIKNI